MRVLCQTQELLVTVEPGFSRLEIGNPPVIGIVRGLMS
jgi:hypothetical protein